MKFSGILIALALVSLSACSGSTVKQSLGLNREGPDEFRVVPRPPLSVPPEYNLRPPGTTAAPGFAPTDKQAQQLLQGDTSATAKLPPAAKTSSGKAESQFLKDAGADKANPNVRSELNQPQPYMQEPAEEQEESHWWNPFSWWGSDKKDQEPVVDANGESQRIQQDKAQGKPVTEGDTPDVKQKDTGVLGEILGY